MEERKRNLLGGALLIAGTTIGGGILGLPVLTSVAGFMPSVFAFILCWLFMCATGLLFLEIAQWMQGESNIISMTKKILGEPGKYIAWILYIFLFYCLMVAYLVGCGNLVTEFTSHALPDWSGSIIFAVLFAPLILIPTAMAGRLNTWLVAGLAISYFAFVFLGFRYVKTDLLTYVDWSNTSLVLPIAFISFAYQGTIPTLITYMHHDTKNIRKAIIIGSMIPLFAYLIWEWLILGIVPLNGPGGLLETLNNGDNAVVPLKNYLAHPAIYGIGQAFAFFALVTSFLGVSLGLRDFLADGLGIKKDAKGKLLLALLVYTIPLIIAVSHPHVFLIALDYAGGFGSALLLGLLPIVMAWRGRYQMRLPANEQVPGGRVVLGLLGVFVIFELVMETRHVLAR